MTRLAPYLARLWRALAAPCPPILTSARAPLAPRAWLLPPLVLALAACVSRPTPSVVPSPAAPTAEEAPESGASALDLLRQRGLVVPVAGVALDRIPDTFGAARGARRHGALDIMAPRGTPVLSADDGRILRLGTNALGGITIYATDASERLVYYYAHLDRYAGGVTAGMRLARGDTIGFVGTTGNAPPNAPHLHFQVMVPVPGRKYWEGEPVDPRPYLTTTAPR